MVQWLRLHLPMQGVWVRSLVRELRFHIPRGQKTKTKSRSYIATNSIKTLKILQIKKKLLKKETEERDHEPKKCGQYLEARNTGETDSSLNPPERNTTNSFNTLLLVQ